MYNNRQIKLITDELQKRYTGGSIENYEIVITLLAMQKSGKISIKHIGEILLHVFNGNKIQVLKALEVADCLVDDTLIDNVIEDVNSQQCN